MLRLTLLSGRWQSGWPLLLGVLFALSCMHNRPDAPAVPVGPSSVEADSAYTFKTSASNGKEYGLVYVRFDWGGGDTSPWSGHGETFEMSHSWRDGGVYSVRAQAHDDRSEFSEWSEPLNVTAVVPPYPYRITDSADLDGVELLDALVLPNGKFIYVTDHDGTMSVVRTSNMKRIAQIVLNGSCSSAQLVSSPDGEYIYATEYQYDGVAVVRTRDNVVVDSLMVGSDTEPTSIAISPDGKHLYVGVDSDSGFIVAVRLPDNAVEDTIRTLGAYSYTTSLKVAPDGACLYAADSEDRVCSIRLSDKALKWQVPASVSGGPDGFVVDPTGELLYVLDNERILVLRADIGTPIDSIPLSTLWGADIAPDGSFVYATCCGEDDNGTVAVVRISDNKVVRVIAVPGGVCGVASSPDGQYLYVAGNGKLYVLSR